MAERFSHPLSLPQESTTFDAHIWSNICYYCSLFSLELVSLCLWKTTSIIIELKDVLVEA